MSEPAHEWVGVAILCDSAQVADGKLYVLGGGWSLCGPGPFVHSLAFKLDVPWNQANRSHSLGAVLIDEDEKPVLLGDPPAELRFETEFEVGRPPGLKPGTSLDVPLAVNFGPMELPPAQNFSWVISVDKHEVKRVRFQTRTGSVSTKA